MLSPSFLAFLLSIGTLAIYYVIRRTSSRLPPGPPGLPLIGNLLRMSANHKWLTFAKWAETYGDVMQFSVLGRPYIVLSSRAAINELLDKRSAIYSDRPHFPIIGDLVGYNQHMAMCRYNNHHKEMRRMIFGLFNARRSPEFHPMQESKVLLLLPRLLSEPQRFRSHIRWLIASITFSITHGYVVADTNDPLVELAEQVNDEFSVGVSPGTFLADTLPILRHIPEWFPGGGFKTRARRYRRTVSRFLEEPYNMVKDQVIRGVASPCFTAELLQHNANPTPEEEYLYKCASSTIYAAGADTTVSALGSFFLAMSVYGDVQLKAQDELDRVVGRGRLPLFTDRSQLPYIDALLKEVHRWNPVAPMALPHRVMRDDEYEGYHIPADAIVIVNSWSVLHDPSLYPDPFTFDPERYFSKANVGEGMNPDPRTWAFGYGRRVCPGQILAEDTLFIAASTVLACFDIAKAVRPDGSTVEPKIAYTGAIISHAGPFECRITPRSPEVERLIKNIGI